jgi:hypothetical protein
MNNDAKFLKPCLVMGTGFHRWVLGESIGRDFDPLLDWNELILDVAKELGVPLDRTSYSLSLQWEQMLAIARHDGGFERGVDGRTIRPAINNLEKTAKKIAVNILTKSQSNYPVNSYRAKLPLNPLWGAVVSLNFDANWLPTASKNWQSIKKSELNLTSIRGNGSTLNAELVRLNNHKILPTCDSFKRRLWFPNGYVGNYNSLRLGLREFGFQSVAIHAAFNALKAFERDVDNFEKVKNFLCLNFEEQGKTDCFDKGSKLPLTWATEMIYRPVCFAGVGMSDSENGLWWLMVQRARNLAGVHPKLRPPAAILLKHDDQRLPFWNKKPCGIEPIVCSNWEEGWDKVLNWGESL